MGTARPDYPLDDLLVLHGEDQVRAMGNLARYRMLGVLADRAATLSGLAEALGIRKGSADHHLRVLAAAGLVRPVRTRTVRGGTERYWGRTARSFEVAPDNPAYHDRALLLRTVAQELEAAAGAADPSLTVARFRLRPEDYRLLGERLADLVAEFQGRTDPAGDPVTISVALFRTARRGGTDVPDDSAEDTEHGIADDITDGIPDGIPDGNVGGAG
ncbi:ArsR/SmtB family transcription factor [Nakamurella endophytica]|uniref:HTH arsR-type domain-containing protein n=1 Tax=Nakamurella endophytica TaxID=1748367 RepID=A0A917SUR7_9ACTN|nr:winged helix-turn-helix domain-containing protein [Nakamurella endophytica]GGL97421.1 hypothetical protein GCM10011594_16500 [Nakamurella endophytica]